MLIRPELIENLTKNKLQNTKLKGLEKNKKYQLK